jgi:hypothetical protein
MAQEILKAQLGAEDASKINQPYFPIIGYSRGDLTFDMARNFGEHRLRDMGIKLPERKTRFTSVWPRPYEIPITIDVWTLTETYLDKWVVWLGQQAVSGLFNFVIDFSKLWSGWIKKLIVADHGGLVNNSDIESVEEGRTAEKRYTLSMTLRGWLFLNVEEVKTVLKITQDMYAISHGVDLSSLTVDDLLDQERVSRIIYTNTGWRKEQ